MKSEGGGQVIAFPGSKGQAPYMHSRRGNDCGGLQDRRLEGEAFLQVLRSNIESAEEIAFGEQTGLKRVESEEDALRREELLEPGHFGTLFGAVEATAVLAMKAHVIPKMDASDAQSDPASSLLQVAGYAPEGRAETGKSEKKVTLLKGGLQAMLAATGELPPEAQVDADSILRVGQSQDQAMPRSALDIMPLHIARDEPSQQHPLHIVARALADVSVIAGPLVGDGRQLGPGQDDSARSKRDGRPSQFPDDAAGLRAVDAVAAAAETDLMPALPEAASTVRQIADNIRQAVPVTFTGPAPAQADQSRTIRFILQPENLGEVEIKIRLRGDNVEIAIQVEKPEAAKMIAVSQDELRSVLGEHGLRLETIDVGLGRAVRESGSSGQTDSQSQSNQQFQRQEQGAAGGSNGFRHRTGQPEWLQPAHQDGKEDAKPVSESNVRTAVRRGLYL